MEKDFIKEASNKVQKWISAENISQKAYSQIKNSIGENCIWDFHNTYFQIAKKYKYPIWLLPDKELEDNDKSVVKSNKQLILNIQKTCHKFSSDLINRI